MKKFNPDSLREITGKILKSEIVYEGGYERDIVVHCEKGKIKYKYDLQKNVSSNHTFYPDDV